MTINCLPVDYETFLLSWGFKDTSWLGSELSSLIEEVTPPELELIFYHPPRH